VITSAIYKLYPQVKYINGETAYDDSGNEVVYDKAVVEAYVNANLYKVERAKEYPPIGDQLDALWKGGVEAEAMLAKVQAVKAKYPKGVV